MAASAPLTTGTRHPSSRASALAVGPELNLAGEPTTLAQALQRSARSHGRAEMSSIARDGSATVLTYAGLLDEAMRAAGALVDRGVAPGAPVLLQLERYEDNLRAWWGCILSGALPISVAVPPTYDDEDEVVKKLRGVWEFLGCPPIVTRSDSAQQKGLRRLFGASLRLLTAGELLDHDACRTVHPARPEDVAFLQLTSGTTGRPKCIMLTHENILRETIAAARVNGMSSDSVMFGWMAMDHVGASVFHNVRSTYLGCRQVYASVEYILDDPLRWLDAVSRHGVTHTFSPNFAYELIVKRLREISPPAGRWALGPLTSIINGGEQVSLQGVRSFLTALAGYGLRPSAMQPGWGMSEMGGGVTHGLRLDLERHAGFHIVDRGSLAPGSPAVFVGRDHPDGVVLVEVGGPMPGATVRVVDQDLQLVPEDTIGFIQCQGRMTMPGYYQDQAATEAAFTRDGWIDTGDLGFLHEGELTITGRAKDIVIVRGRNLLCHDIEAVASVDGVEAPFVAALSAMDDESNRERLVIFFAPQEGRAPGDAAQTAGRIRAAVASKLGVEVDLALPYAADAFPRTTSGKIRRGELRRRVESGELDQLVSEATTLADAPGDATSDLRSDEERQVAALWQELLGAPVRRREDNFFELGGHSVLAVSLVRQLGERFGVHLSIGQLVECQTVATMAALVSGAGESQASKHLVAFQAKGEAAPLVCIHATGGDILYYKRLADVLGPRQPVFGLQSRALLSADEYETIDEMAQAYAEVIRAHVPGPRSLVGWSMGGVLAVAMAKIFEEWGEEVAFVGLLDSHLARVGTRPDPLMAIELAFGGSLSAAFAATPEADRRALAESLATLSPGERDRRVVEWGREKKLFTEPLDVDDLTRRIGLGVHHAEMLEGYRPARIEAPIHVWWASDGNVSSRPDWRELTRGAVIERSLPGDHLAMVRPPVIDTWAREVGAILRHLDRTAR